MNMRVGYPPRSRRVQPYDGTGRPPVRAAAPPGAAQASSRPRPRSAGPAARRSVDAPAKQSWPRTFAQFQAAAAAAAAGVHGNSDAEAQRSSGSGPFSGAPAPPKKFGSPWAPRPAAQRPSSAAPLRPQSAAAATAAARAASAAAHAAAASWGAQRPAYSSARHAPARVAAEPASLAAARAPPASLAAWLGAAPGAPPDARRAAAPQYTSSAPRPQSAATMRAPDERRDSEHRDEAPADDAAHPAQQTRRREYAPPPSRPPAQAYPQYPQYAPPQHANPQHSKPPQPTPAAALYGRPTSATVGRPATTSAPAQRPASAAPARAAAKSEDYASAAKARESYEAAKAMQYYDNKAFPPAAVAVESPQAASPRAAAASRAPGRDAGGSGADAGLYVGRAADVDRAIVDDALASNRHGQRRRDDERRRESIDAAAREAAAREAAAAQDLGKRRSENARAPGEADDDFGRETREASDGDADDRDALVRALVATAQRKRGAPDFYTFGKVVGVGSFGTVRLARHKLTGVKVAIKTYERAKMKDPQQWKRVQQEARVMEKLSDSPLVCRFFEGFDTALPRRAHLVMEFLPGGNLCSYVKAKRKLEERELRPLVLQLAMAVEHMHSLNVVHRDIKLENILFVDETHCNIRVIDFGFSTRCAPDRRLRLFCGTPSYMAPEIVKRTEYRGKPIDLWSFGVVTYACIGGHFPFAARSQQELYRKILRGTYRLPDGISDGAADLVRGCLTPDVSRRVTAPDARQLAWLQGLDMPTLALSNFSRAKNPRDDIRRESMQRMESLGVPRDALIQQITNAEHTPITACYYLLMGSMQLRDKAPTKARPLSAPPGKAPQSSWAAKENMANHAASKGDAPCRP
ncbi:kinase-like domain-containing protein [Pelagophyceae sp. CCMP2097]|nr:kinase-like domain-containing protein [Pelagophyceae sp. CCMP2097]